MPALSAFIIALDEADCIGAAIDSLRGIAEEVVVLDSGSADGPPEVAERLGARVICHPWAGYGPQKRAGEDACRHDWLINLDADQALTPALAAEIAARAADGSLWQKPFWRMREEIAAALAPLRAQGTRFAVATPAAPAGLEVF